MADHAIETEDTLVTTRTVTLPGGESITVRRATVRSNALSRSLQQRFGPSFADLGPEMSQHFTYFVLCASYVVEVKGTKWTPPGLFADEATVRRSFEGWLALLPDMDSLLAWLEAVNAVNRAANPDELTPDFDGAGLDAADPK